MTVDVKIAAATVSAALSPGTELTMLLTSAAAMNANSVAILLCEKAMVPG